MKDIDTNRLLLRADTFGLENPFNYSMALSTLYFYFCKSDRGNLIGRQETRCENRVAPVKSRRCRGWREDWPPSNLRACNTLTLPPFPRAEVSFLNYENDASRLFVKREAAGEISRRSAVAGQPPPFLRSSALLLRCPDKPTGAQRAPFLPDSPRGTRKWLHYNECVSGTPDRLARARSHRLARVPFTLYFSSTS